VAREFRYRGRTIETEDILYIRGLIGAHPNHSRRSLSRKLCEAWQWRQFQGRHFRLTDVAGEVVRPLLAPALAKCSLRVV
jgi:hypothetical protein